MSAQQASGPVPQGLYLAARRHGDLVYTSGMTPRRAGVLTSTGKIGAATRSTATRTLSSWPQAMR